MEAKWIVKITRKIWNAAIVAMSRAAAKAFAVNAWHIINVQENCPRVISRIMSSEPMTGRLHGLSQYKNVNFF